MATASSDDPILTALQARGSAIRRIRYRANRSVLLSVSRDGRALNSHECFRDAPPEIVDAMVAVVTITRGTRARRAALRTLREWEGTRRGLERARRGRPRKGRKVNGRETEPLRRLFRELNVEEFGGRLPEIPLRVSRRMTRALGTVRYGDGSDSPAGVDPGAGSGGGPPTGSGRWVMELAISADLLRPANRAALRDTMLHEMAHAEAWLRHGHKGHGRPWRRIAERVGCRPRAVNDVRVAGRQR